MRNFIYLVLLLPVIFLASGCEDSDPPEFISVEPGFGSETQLIVLKGNNLGEIRELLFNGVPIQFNTAYNSDVALLFRVPKGTPLGATIVTVRTDHGSFEFDFLVSELPPTIRSFTPRSADPGQIITVTGENFFDPPLDMYFRVDRMSPDDPMRLDSIVGEITYVSETKDTMRVRVPEGAVSGPLVVVANGGVYETTINFFTFRRSLVTDFDGGGSRADNGQLIARGNLDQVINGSPFVTSTFPAPIDGDYLKMSGIRSGSTTSFVGFIQTSPLLDSFDIDATVANAFIELDLNSAGRANSYLTVALREQDGRIGDFSTNIKLEDAAGWNTVRVPLVRFRNSNNFVVTPGKVNVVKFILQDLDNTGRRVEANIDNVKFVEQN